MNTTYVVAIREPMQLRKNVLRSAKFAIEVTKTQKRLLDIRIERKRVLSELQASIDALAELMKTLNEHLPAHSAKTLPKALKNIKLPTRKDVLVSGSSRTSDVKDIAPPPKSDGVAGLDVDALERKLSAIESKLNKL